MQYRPAIDGLRSLAVLSVLFYHFQMFHFRGGFLGVDIFFVISGYLISSLVFEEAAATGRISFSRFWLRRARRILPALFFMLGGVSVLVWLLCSGTSLLPEYAKSLLASLFSVSNFLFFSQSGYFDAESITKPLLHTWSLGVEEQFYLFFPLIFHWVLIKAKVGRRALLMGLFAAIALSCAACFLLRGERASAFAFFMLPTRLWELLAGTALAYAQRENLLPAFGKKLSLAFELAALAAIASGVLYAERTLGIWNVMVVCGTIVLLHAQNGYTASVLARKPFVTIGKLSYSLYLWHWPLVVFLSLFMGKIQSGQKAALLFVTLLCSFISHRYVEQPMRKPWIGWKQIAVRLGPALLCLGAIGLGMLLIKQAPAVLTPQNSPVQQQAAGVETTPYEREGATLSVSHLGSLNDDLDFILLGDSHAWAIKEISFLMAEEYKLHGAMFDPGATFFVPEFQQSDNYVLRSALARLANTFIREHPPKAIILAQRWICYIDRFPMSYKGQSVKKKTREAWARKLMKEHLRQWLDAGIVVFLMEQVPEHPNRSMEMAAFFTHATPQSDIIGTSLVTDLVREMNHPNLRLLPVGEVFRTGDAYYFIKDGKLLYHDYNHLNFFGQQEIAPVLRPAFEYLQSRKQAR